MTLLTKKQKDIFDYLREYIGDKGFAPSIKEICDHFGTTSVSTMHKQLMALEKKGYIRRIPKMQRAIELVDRRADETEFTEVPVMGTVREGAPIESVNMIEYHRLPDKFSKGSRIYMLEVKGDFFEGMLIRNGDLVVIESKSELQNGEQLALVRLDKRNVTLRRVSKNQDKVIIHSLSSGFENHTLDMSSVKFLGIIIGIIRDYLD